MAVENVAQGGDLHGQPAARRQRAVHHRDGFDDAVYRSRLESAPCSRNHRFAVTSKDGYVIPDFRLGDEALAGIRHAHDRLIAKHPEFRDYCPAVLAFDTGFLNIARTPAILAMVEQLIGADFALWNSSFFAKPPKVGTKTPWHQDGEYWPISAAGHLFGCG